MGRETLTDANKRKADLHCNCRGDNDQERTAMSLLKCPDCEKDISTRAYFCPSCGRLARHGYPAFVTAGIVAGLVALAALKYLLFDLFGG